MHLTLTQYLDAEPVAVAGELERAIVRGLDAAATRVTAERDDVVTEQTADGIRVRRGLQILDGSELRVSGSSRFTTLEIVVPWLAGDDNGVKLLAANAFAHAVAAEVRAAA